MKIIYLPELHGKSLVEAVEMLQQTPGVPITCVDWPEVYDAKPDVSLRIAHDGVRAYIMWQVSNEMVRTTKTNDLEQVCEDSCCELFFRVPGSVLYTNLEVNANGVMTASRRTARKENVERFTEDEFRQIERYSSLGTEPMMPAIPKDYDLCIALPLELMGIDSANMPQCMMLNSYKCGDKTPQPHYVSLFPITTPTPDFHCPQFFQRVEIENAQ